MTEIQKEYAEELIASGDTFMRYSCLVEYAMMLPPLPGEKRLHAALVEGCMSQVWIGVEQSENGEASFLLDSDTLIIRGILYILREVFMGYSEEEAASFEFSLLRDSGLEDLFSSRRQVGLQSIVATMKSLAQQYMVPRYLAGTYSSTTSQTRQ